MAWRYKGETDKLMIWECDFYTDLTKHEIDNFIEYFQPFSPYENSSYQHGSYDPDDLSKPYPQGYNHRIKIVDKQIAIRMPRQQVMTMGFGQQIDLTDFPVTRKFFDGDYDLPLGTHTLRSLINRFNIKKQEYKIEPSFYPFGGLSGTKNAPVYPMYVYGTTGFTLVPDKTTLTVSHGSQSIRGYIFLTDDQWDYKSKSGFASALNPFVEVFSGPSQNNLSKGGILIQYTGSGTYKQMSQRR